MDAATCRDLFASARVATLATTGDGGPHIVPIVFAVAGNHIITAVDRKPKTTTALRRLENIAQHARVSLLTHHYSEDWTDLWWVRADGEATVTQAVQSNLASLVAKYDQYADDPPPGPVISVQVERWTGWAASS